MMKSIGYSLILLGFAILLTSVPADAEKYGNTEFFLAKSGIGDIYDLTIDEPSEATPKGKRVRQASRTKENNREPQRTQWGTIHLGPSRGHAAFQTPAPHMDPETDHQGTKNVSPF